MKDRIWELRQTWRRSWGEKCVRHTTNSDSINELWTKFGSSARRGGRRFRRSLGMSWRTQMWCRRRSTPIAMLHRSSCTFRTKSTTITCLTVHQPIVLTNCGAIQKFIAIRALNICLSGLARYLWHKCRTFKQFLCQSPPFYPRAILESHAYDNSNIPGPVAFSAA